MCLLWQQKKPHNRPQEPVMQRRVNTIENMVCACGRCNVMKDKFTYEEFIYHRTVGLAQFGKKHLKLYFRQVKRSWDYKNLFGLMAAA